MITVFAALAVAKGNEDDPAFDAVCMTPDEAHAIAEPAARILARTGINKKFGSKLVQSNDYIALIMACGAYGLRAMPAVGAKVASNVQVPKPSRSVRKTSANGSTGPASADISAQPDIYPAPWNLAI